MPVLQKLKEAYKIWQDILPHISKSHRQTIEKKVDELLLEELDLGFRATYSSGLRKLELVKEAVINNDLAKFFLLVAWECKIMEEKKYIRISKMLVESGQMLYRWREFLEKKTPQDQNRDPSGKIDSFERRNGCRHSRRYCCRAG